MSELSTSLAHHLLVALPSLTDPTFARSVALICQHDDNGAMGVLVNQPSDYTIGEVLAQMDITTDNDHDAAVCLPLHSVEVDEDRSSLETNESSRGLYDILTVEGNII
jgi:putative AlgH/UPF0301 family transcriptional regulator